MQHAVAAEIPNLQQPTVSSQCFWKIALNDVEIELAGH
jgi:hypothetical protein